MFLTLRTPEFTDLPERFENPDLLTLVAGERAVYVDHGDGDPIMVETDNPHTCIIVDDRRCLACEGYALAVGDLLGWAIPPNTFDPDDPRTFSESEPHHA